MAAVLRLARHLRLGRHGVTIAKVMSLRSLSLAVNICTGLITAALLGPAGRGELAALTVAPQVLAGLATLGLPGALIYNIKADPEHERRYISNAVVMTFAAGLVAAAIGWALEPVWLAKYSTRVIDLGRAFLVITPLATVAYTFTATLEARGRFVLANQPAYLQSLCTLAALGILAMLRHLTPATAAVAYLGPGVLGFGYLATLVGYRSYSNARLRSPLSSRLLHFGLRMFGDDVLVAVSPYLDQIVIAATLAPADLGVYVVGASLSRLLNVLPASAATVLFPTLAARPTATITDTVGAAVRVLTAINVAAALCIGLLGPFLLAHFYGSGFLGARAPLEILLVESVVSNAVRLLYQSYVGSGRPGTVTIIQGIGFCVSLGSMLLLVPVYGTIGAASALLIATLVRFGCVIAGMPLILRVRVPRLIIVASDVTRMRGH